MCFHTLAFQKGFDNLENIGQHPHLLVTYTNIFQLVKEQQTPSNASIL